MLAQRPSEVQVRLVLLDVGGLGRLTPGGLQSSYRHRVRRCLAIAVPAIVEETPSRRGKITHKPPPEFASMSVLVSPRTQGGLAFQSRYHILFHSSVPSRSHHPPLPNRKSYQISILNNYCNCLLIFLDFCITISATDHHRHC